MGYSSYSWYLGLAKKTEAAVMEMNNSFANEFTVRAIHRYLGILPRHMLRGIEMSTELKQVPSRKNIYLATVASRNS